MKLSHLLTQRPALLHEVRLANLAFAYAKLSEIAARIVRARLRGSINLKQPGADAECDGLPLTALEGNQSVIEEHFTDEEVADFADAVAFITGVSRLDLTFRIEETEENFVAPLRHQLEQAGITLDHAAQSIEEPHRESTSE
jgi:hypothetical protein